MALPDPKNRRAGDPEVSEKEAKLGVYVFQPKNAQDEPVGDKKYLASNDAAHVEAFLHAGYRAASDAETEEYRKMSSAARQESRDALTGVTSDKGDDSKVKDLQAQLDEERAKREEAERATLKSSENKTGTKVETSKENK